MLRNPYTVAMSNNPDPQVYARLLQRLTALRQSAPDEIDQEIDLVVKLAVHPVRVPESTHRWLWTVAS
jgi:hypothetical protein